MRTALASPTRNPDSPGTRPGVCWQLIRDKYTGMHFIRFPDSPHQPGTIEVHYLLQHRSQLRGRAAGPPLSPVADGLLERHMQTLQSWCAQGLAAVGTRGPAAIG